MEKLVAIYGWMDKDVVYVHNGILFSFKEEGNPAFCDNIDRPWEHCAKWSKSEKDKYYMFSLIYGIYKNKLIEIESTWYFPGGAVVKNPPANAGDTGSIPGLGRPHIPQSN